MRGETITITTTALAGQAELIAETFQSFTERLQGVNWKRSGLILNTDPTPVDSDPRPVERAARAAGVGMVATLRPGPEGANFPWALGRVWGCLRPGGPRWVLHVESDWRLLEAVKIEDLIEPMLADPFCYASSLRYYPFKSSKLVLLPSLWRKSFIIEHLISQPLDPNENPETQLRERLNTLNKNRGNKKYYNVHYPTGQHSRVLFDSGKAWKIQNRLKKNGQGAKDFIAMKKIGQ